MSQSTEALWRQVQDELRASVTDSTFNLFFEPLRPVATRGPTLYLTGPPRVLRWVERRYGEWVRAALLKQRSELREVGFVPTPIEGGRTNGSRPCDGAARVILNPGYTFDRFVIGAGNRLAHGAALAVAEAPGQAYNPLFLHGPPGLGKTHLLGAIANYLDRHSPELDVRYTTAECFTNEFVSALRSSAADSFKAAYRGVNVLLIDDVQFLEGKTHTADEFFHTFNTLFESGAQIVLSADRMPSSLAAIAERLRDRFEWGLIASLDPPDRRTRATFVLNRLDQRQQTVESEAVDALAGRACANLRLLEGALTRVLALSSLTGASITGELVSQALPSAVVAPAPSHQVTVVEVQQHVASDFGLSSDQLLSQSRRANLSGARQLAMYLTRELTDLSLPAIAAAFNRRDHTTILHAVRQVERKLENEPTLATRAHRIRAELTSPPAQEGS